MDKKLLILVIACIALAQAEPQLTLGLGQTKLAYQDTFRFAANNGNAELILDPYSRLQFGLAYDHTSARIDKHTTYSCYGWLGTIKIVLNTLSNKTPYFGLRGGWLNTDLAHETIIYRARGSATTESFAGYSFKLDELQRLNIEYKNKAVFLKHEETPIQHAETWTLSWSLILDNSEQAVQRGIDKTENQTTKQAYLKQKIAYNNNQIIKLDKLIDKYNQRILQEGATDQINAERNFLLDQKKELETENKEMWDLLAL